MSLLYHAYVYLEFLILACTFYILAPITTAAMKIIVAGYWFFTGFIRKFISFFVSVKSLALTKA